MSPTSHTHPYGGYALKAIKEMRTSDGVAFTATLTLDGKPLGTVENTGRGGCNLYRLSTHAEHQAFLAFTKTLDPDTFEADDALIERLFLVAQLNKARTVVFILDGDDPFTTGAYRHYKSDVSLDEALRHLTGPGYNHKRPKVWVKARNEFVPAAELVAG